MKKVFMNLLNFIKKLNERSGYFTKNVGKRLKGMVRELD